MVKNCDTYNGAYCTKCRAGFFLKSSVGAASNFDLCVECPPAYQSVYISQNVIGDGSGKEKKKIHFNLSPPEFKIKYLEKI